jgi:hypothetical protein
MKTAVFKRFATQFKGVVPVDLPGKQAVLGLAELHTAVEQLLRHGMLSAGFVYTTVNEAMVGDRDFFDDQGLAILCSNAFAGLVLDPAERGVVPGVHTPLPRRGETQFNPAGGGFGHDTQPQF